MVTKYEQQPEHSADSTFRHSVGRLLLGLGLILIAFNLRPLFASLSVLLPDMLKQQVLTSVQAGYLTTLPVLCLGIFAPLAPWLSQRIGNNRTLLLIMLLLTVGTAMRGMGSLFPLFFGSAVAGMAIAIGNVLLPAIVKKEFPGAIALMTGSYTMALCAGAAVAAAGTLPLIRWLETSWADGLALWALPAGVVLLLWAPYAMATKCEQTGKQSHVVGLWRDSLAWQVTFFMGLQSALGYSVFGWIVPILHDRGLGEVQAGLILSFSIVVQLVACFVLPALAVRCSNQSWINVALALAAALGFLGMLFGPLEWVWEFSVLQGIGQGGLFALALTVIVLRSADSRIAAHLSSMAQSVGYTLAAFGPLLIGVLHSLTGGFAASGWLFSALCLGAAISGWGAGRTKLVRATYVMDNK
ncbi:putative transporter YycB [Nitrosomonas stercoris]|uniref:Putative transporter YycB n=1 Tax=Nitrosomonas stercoris TaxID=1444684 RepID=A0A4Y1YN03_9PROT|nr:putative transporter YycB [Nitrosomonas stercoris]